MNKSMTVKGFFVTLLLLLASCQGTPSKEANVEAIDNETVLALDNLSFKLKNERLDDEERPVAELWLSAGSKDWKVSDIIGGGNVLEKREWDDAFIPQNALAAFHVHWGEGTWYYVVKSENALEIHEGGPVQTGMEGRWQGYYELKASIKL